uniref:Uncharacterized protein n=1 Tax=Solanum lycopersicum TaxID=4081 RepID=A0A3Q7I5Q3_SOLLC
VTCLPKRYLQLTHHLFVLSTFSLHRSLL